MKTPCPASNPGTRRQHRHPASAPEMPGRTCYRTAIPAADEADADNANIRSTRPSLLRALRRARSIEIILPLAVSAESLSKSPGWLTGLPLMPN